MLAFTRSLATLAVVALMAAPATGLAATPIGVVAAENFYGDIARQIGGPQVTVTSVLSNPDQDPHLFEASPSVARAIASARIVIYNGVDYDPWIEKLLRASGSKGREVVAVAALVGRKIGDNPHLWYDPATMPALAGTLAGEFGGIDPAHRSDFSARVGQFTQSFEAVTAQIAALRERLAGTRVTATEPVLGYLLAALRMQVTNPRFQLAVMNNTEPSASEIAAFEDDLRLHRVRLLFYNSQASDPVARRMLEIARAANIPIVGASETEPAGTTYQAWIASVLDAIDRALPP